MDFQALSLVRPVLCKRGSEQYEKGGILAELIFNDYGLLTCVQSSLC